MCQRLTAMGVVPLVTDGGPTRYDGIWVCLNVLKKDLRINGELNSISAKNTGPPVLLGVAGRLRD